VLYLPGETPDQAMIEVRLVDNNKPVLVRLGPAGFLKENQVVLKEGDTIAVTGYTFSSAREDLLVATEVATDRVTVRLWDTSGRPRW
jgi:hypothetical protein